MEKFFENVGYDSTTIVIKPELLSIEPFCEIWERDTSKNKFIARKELTWIWCMCNRDSDNIYYSYTNKQQRMNIITSDIFKNMPWSPDTVVEEAIKIYVERNPKNVYEETAEFVNEQLEELKDVIKEMDYRETTNTGALKLDPEKIQKTFIAMMALTKQLAEFKLLATEERNRGKIRGGGEYNPLEDPKYMNTNDDTTTVTRSKSKTPKK